MSTENINDWYCLNCWNSECMNEDTKKKLVGEYIDIIIEYTKELTQAVDSMDFHTALNIENELLPHWKQEILDLI